MTVLIVEDDADFAILTKRFLEDRQGILAIIETHPSNVVDRILSGEIDCIVSDWDMPEMDGIELLKKVREVDSDFPFIVYTGRGSEEIASNAISAGATEYLQKRTGTDQFDTLAYRITNAVQEVKQSEWRKKIVKRQKIGIILAILSAIIAITGLFVALL